MLTLYFDQLCLKLVSSELISLNETQPTLPLNSDNDFTGSVLTSAVLRLECSLDCLSAPTYRYIAPRMIQRIILKFCGYVGCDDATNVSNFGYEPIKLNQ